MEMIKNLVLSGAGDLDKNPPKDWMVVVMGIGIVFVGLILIILICKVMGMFFTKKTTTNSEQPTDPVVTAPVAQATSTPIENRQEIIAAVTAVCAEEMGKDVSALRVISFKKL